MVRLELPAAALVLFLFLAACGEEPAPSSDATPVAPLPAPGPVAEVTLEPESPSEPAVPPAPAASATEEGEEDWQPPSDWCGTDRIREVWERPPLDQWQEISPGLWRRIFHRRTNGRRVVEWGEDRDGRFITWQEEVEPGERPLFGTERVPDRPRARPPR